MCVGFSGSEDVALATDREKARAMTVEAETTMVNTAAAMSASFRGVPMKMHLLSLEGEPPWKKGAPLGVWGLGRKSSRKCAFGQKLALFLAG